MLRGKRVWRRRWYYVDSQTERGIRALANELCCSSPDLLHALIEQAMVRDIDDYGLLNYLPKTPFHKGDETDGPTEGD